MRFLASATVLAALVGVAPAFANTGIGAEPMSTVKVAVSGVESQAQIATQLQNQGYKQVMFSASLPNGLNPQPQLTNPTKDLAQTPAHKGWNGTAYKDGKLYDVYVGK